MNPVLREAVSSPYIGSQLKSMSIQNINNNNNNNVEETRKLHSALSDDRFEKLRDMANSVQFQTGSSSSTDLHFYTESKGNADILEQWAKLHEEQRQQHQQQQQQYFDTNRNQKNEAQTTKAESTNDLAETEEGSSLGKYRSETNLPGKARDGGFRLLEKCCSVELNNPAANMFPHSRLTRTKEMPNIADVDDEIAISDA